VKLDPISIGGDKLIGTFVGVGGTEEAVAGIGVEAGVQEFITREIASMLQRDFFIK
jgi:hypothetical protein